MTDTVLLKYRARLTEWEDTARKLGVGRVAAMFAFGLALAALVATLYFTFLKASWPVWWLFIPLLAIWYTADLYRRRNSALIRSSRLRHFYEQGCGRLEEAWAGLGVRGEEFSVENHPYEKDLNLFGEGSLFERLCTCRTGIGRRSLARFLLQTPTALHDATARQAAVQELADKAGLREQVALLGEFSFQESTWEVLHAWAQSPVVRVPLTLRLFAIATSSCLTMLLLLGCSSMVAWSALAPWLGGILLIHGALGLIFRSRVLSALPAARALRLEIGVLREGIALLGLQTFESKLLQRLIQSGREAQAASALGTLGRLIGILQERDKEWFYAISRALLVGTQAFWAVESWKARYAQSLLEWAASWGEFEALLAVAGYAHENPDSVYPQLLDRTGPLIAADLGHPLLPLDKCVRNEIAFDSSTRFYIVSGSNMAGKSTLLRAVGVNVVLAYCGAPVRATLMTVPVLPICASLFLQDSLLNGTSRFFGEIDRVKRAVELAAAHGSVLFLIDELLSGTNSKDRRIAAEVILRALVDRGGIGILSTHDLALTSLAELPGLSGRNVHMGSCDATDPLQFDYLIKPGVTEESSALAILRLAGLGD